ncbi:hypothetical protein SRHO_G00025050 [Serrasalmus rhombeus]
MVCIQFQVYLGFHKLLMGCSLQQKGCASLTMRAVQEWENLLELQVDLPSWITSPQEMHPGQVTWTGHQSIMGQTHRFNLAYPIGLTTFLDCGRK